ncbi:MAG: class I SAM-dependent rRNA methyltransferase [Bdellovibrionales bacterium]|nr:class I SAM-dependent rRNA methyltransferase [Bdellovibrionales bacterium]
MTTIAESLEAAWKKRKTAIDRQSPVRVFHGDGEGRGALASIAIEKFLDFYWVFEWQGSSKKLSKAQLDEVSEFLKSKEAKGAVHLFRPEKGTPDFPSPLFGKPPESVTVFEGTRKSLIRFENTRHPGLFLDHEPIRNWLQENSKGKRILNTFCYTGSISVAAGLGGASAVVNLDLSKPTLKWSEENWVLNGLAREKLKIVADDYFAALPRFAKRKELFDVIVLDPPSFSRGLKGNFSTSKDLGKLHRLALDVLAPGGVLISSINSENVSVQEFDAQVDPVIAATKRNLKKLFPIAQPGSFPGVKYLKGWVYAESTVP